MSTTMVEPQGTRASSAPTSARLPHLDAMRGLGILLVVGMHAHGYTHLSLPTTTEHLWSRVAGVSVPLFYLADGYLFALTARRAEPFHGVAFLRKSASRLLIPYLSFTLIDLVLRAGFEAAGFLPVKLVVGRSLPQILTSVFFSEIAMQMYFLPALFLIRCLWPVTLRLTRLGASAALGATAALLVALPMSGLKLGDDPITSALFGMPYYWLGLSAFHWEGRLKARAGRIALCALATFAVLFAFEDRGIIPKPAGGIVQCAIIVGEYTAFLALGNAHGPLPWFGRRTMEIYLLHAPVLLKLAQVFLGKFTSAPLLLWPLIWASSLFGSLLLARWLSKSRTFRRWGFGIESN